MDMSGTRFLRSDSWIRSGPIPRPASRATDVEKGRLDAAVPPGGRIAAVSSANSCCCVPAMWTKSTRSNRTRSFRVMFPTGPVGRLNVDEEAAYRVGFTICASPCTSLVASWTQVRG